MVPMTSFFIEKWQFWGSFRYFLLSSRYWNEPYWSACQNGTFHSLIGSLVWMQDWFLWRHFFLFFSFFYLVHPRGPPILPHTQNDPRNKNNIVIPFICHLREQFIIKNSWVIALYIYTYIFNVASLFVTILVSKCVGDKYNHHKWLPRLANEIYCNICWVYRVIWGMG